VNQTWKDTYIHSFTSLSGVWGGSSFSLSSLIATDSWFSTDDTTMRTTVQNWGSITWMCPTQQAFGDTPLVFTPTKKYSAVTLLQLFQDAGATGPAEILPPIEKFRTSDPPGVAINCVFGYNVSTLATLSFPEGFDGPWQNTTADGDGTVMRASLEICAQWATLQEQPVNILRIANMNHSSVVFNDEAIQYFFNSIGLQ